jgi:hypothetical protein
VITIEIENQPSCLYPDSLDPRHPPTLLNSRSLFSMNWIVAYRLATRGGQTPAALMALQKAEIEKWYPVIKAADIKVE